MKRPLGFFQTLRGKIIVLSCAIAMGSAVTVGWINLNRSTQYAVETASQALSAESRVVSTKLSEALADMGEDARIVALTPPIQGLIRSTRNGGVDPLDGSTPDLWRTRLETIFASVLAEHPEYEQLRYIGIADDGRELVRVDRNDGEIRPVPSDELQAKGAEPYFQIGLGLEPGQVRFSEITLNREFGQVDPSRKPMVRALFPVFDESGERYGMIVINTNMQHVLSDALLEIHPAYDTIVLTDAGDYASFSDDTGLTDIELASENAERPAVIDQFTRANRRQVVELDGQFFAGFREPVHSSNSGLAISAVMSESRTELMAPARSAFLTSLLVAAAMVAAALIVTAWVAAALTRPLRDMTEQLRHFDADRARLSLPVHENDEVGELARAFESMVGGLQDSEERLGTIVDSAIDGVMVVDSLGIIESFNPACERLFCVSAQEAIGQSSSIILREDGAYKMDAAREKNPASIAVWLEETSGVPTEHPMQTYDGRPLNVEISFSRMQLADGRHYCAIIRDITERKQMEVMKDEFVATVNHELRTPLTSIYGSLGLLRKLSAEQLDDKGRHLLDLAHNSTERLGHLVNDILDMEKISAGKMEFRTEVVGIGPLVQDIVDRHEGIAQRFNIRFDTRIDLGGESVKVDPNRFNQALVNLLSNAAKHSPDGGTVAIQVARYGISQVKIAVTDNGPGIEESFRPKIFERFAQADSSTARRVEGTGLGLAITKNLIEAFDGKVGFDTELGSGSTFYFILPLASEPARGAA